MKPAIDLSREYGIVLEGGGAKGAYQIGAWRALREAGVKICAVAGTSVGALNGALICMDDVERAQRLWEEICYSRVMDVDDKAMAGIFARQRNHSEAIREILKLIGDRGADITPLKTLIAENLDEDRIRRSPIAFYLQTFSVTEMRELDIDLKEEPYGLLADYLLASAYLPVFKTEKLHGKTYLDGGVLNNVPVDSLVGRGYKDIIVIRIFGPGREKKVKIPEDVTVHQIAPRVHLGNLLEFDCTKSKRNIKIGYYDTMRLLYGLSGTIYYIDEDYGEQFYVNLLLGLEPAFLGQLLSAYKISYEDSRFCSRKLMEHLCPGIASELKLSQNWNYKELVLAMLETAAKCFQAQKYRIYTLEELAGEVVRKGQQVQRPAKAPAFVHVLHDWLNKEEM